MGKVQESLTRLEAAIQRLERAARRGGDGAAATGGKNLDGIDNVAKRLDAVIGRIDRVLEG
jgi:hypothetical protein